MLKGNFNTSKFPLALWQSAKGVRRGGHGAVGAGVKKCLSLKNAKMIQSVSQI